MAAMVLMWPKAELGLGCRWGMATRSMRACSVFSGCSQSYQLIFN